MVDGIADCRRHHSRDEDGPGGQRHQDLGRRPAVLRVVLHVAALPGDGVDAAPGGELGPGDAEAVRATGACGITADSAVEVEVEEEELVSGGGVGSGAGLADGHAGEAGQATAEHEQHQDHRQDESLGRQRGRQKTSGGLDRPYGSCRRGDAPLRHPDVHQRPRTETLGTADGVDPAVGAELDVEVVAWGGYGQPEVQYEQVNSPANTPGGTATVYFVSCMAGYRKERIALYN